MYMGRHALTNTGFLKHLVQSWVRRLHRQTDRQIDRQVQSATQPPVMERPHSENMPRYKTIVSATF